MVILCRLRAYSKKNNLTFSAICDWQEPGKSATRFDCSHGKSLTRAGLNVALHRVVSLVLRVETLSLN